MFKLLALRILRAPDHAHAAAFAKIKKVLRTGCLYRFCDGFEGEIEQEQGDKKTVALPDGFFSLNSQKGRRVKIHVSAIVGKNGDGKSSVVELIIRMLNNLAYVVRDSHQIPIVLNPARVKSYNPSVEQALVDFFQGAGNNPQDVADFVWQPYKEIIRNNWPLSKMTEDLLRQFGIIKN